MVSAAVELKFGSSGTTTTVSAVSGKSIFSSSTSGATITLHTATITDCTTGSGLAEGSIIYLSAGAKGSMTASVITGHKAAGNQMFYISGSTTARSSLTVSGCTIGSTTAANSATGSSFDAVFYVNYGTLSFTKNGSTLNSIVMSDQRAVYAIGSGASITGETNIS